MIIAIAHQGLKFTAENFHLPLCYPKTPEKCAWIGICISSKIKTVLLIPTDFLQNDKDQQYSTWMVWSQHKTNLRWRTAGILDGRHLEISKMALSRHQFERSARSLACWCTFTMLTLPVVKISNFLKIPRMAAIKFKEMLLCNCSQDSATKFEMMMLRPHLNPLALENI